MRWAPQSGFAVAMRVMRALEFGLDRRPTSGRAARELGPVLAETTPLPRQDGIGGYDDEGLPPAGPDSSQADPEQPVRRAELRPILSFACRQRAAGAKRGSRGRGGGGYRRAPGQWSRRVIIELRSWPDPDRQINHVAGGRGFGDGQVSASNRSGWVAISPSRCRAWAKNSRWDGVDSTTRSPHRRASQPTPMRWRSRSPATSRSRSRPFRLCSQWRE
jgi:hypothetical protein